MKDSLELIHRVTVEVLGGVMIFGAFQAAYELQNLLGSQVKVIVKFNDRFYVVDLCSQETNAAGSPLEPEKPQ